MSANTNPVEKQVDILIVDDSPTQAEKLRYLLEQHSYIVTVANNGKQALDHTGKHTPKLVISDIVMPEMNGYELCKRIKAEERTRSIPVILLTSLANSEDVLEGLACGADNFITKPYNEDYLLTKIMQILANRTLRDGERVPVRMEIQFAGITRFITADQHQMLSLLLSTYEAAVNRNRELIQTQNELKSLNDRLEDLVMERTAALSAEITERRNLEERFLQAQKMEAVGRLAGGVAHDFNNMLMVIQGFSDILLKSLPADDKRQMYVGEIRKASERAASLTQQLLTFSRKSAFQSEVLNLKEVIADVEKMLKHLIGEDVDLVVAVDSLTPPVMADRGQLGQVLMNLAVNSRDAMPKGGTLVLRTSLMVIDDTNPALPDVKPGEYALLTVSDTGTGILPEARAHLFEPFFTTKEQGKGTGLGLATVYGIVKQCGGHIWCASLPGKGASFSIYLPRTCEEGSGLGTVETAPEQHRGSETILLVEDDDVVRQIVGTVLTQNGYSVLDCRDGAETTHALEENGDKVDLLITDMVLPGMSGTEIIEAANRRRPGIGVIVMSGYTEREAGVLGGTGAPCLFIQKPFRAETLLRSVRSVLQKKV